MINNLLRGFIYFVVFVLIQVLILNNIHFLRIATPFLYLYFIIKMPVGSSRTQVVFFSFIAGVAGFCREPLIRVFMGKDLPEGIYPSYKTFGFGGFFRYVLSFVLIQHTTLFVIESLTLFDPLFLVVRILSSVVMTTLLICTVEAFNIESQKSGE